MSLPGVCVVCRRPVRWGGRCWRDGSSGRGPRHVCPIDRAACGAWMPIAKERCARTVGHGGEKGYSGHRTRYALDNARYMATGRRVA